MNIYIYGEQSFKKDINKLISKYKIKLRLNGIGEVSNIKKLKTLKEAILLNPKDIFLIDHKKIIETNFITKIFKFLIPKDGIKKDFLLENGLGDLSIDSIDDVAQHIIKRLDAIEQDSGICSIDLKKAESVQESELNIEEPVQKIYHKSIEETNVGVVMSELTQIDDISEADILSALSGIDGLNITASNEAINITSNELPKEEAPTHTIEVDSSNMSDVASLLEQLMNNKTLEISIKVKS